MNTLNNIKSLVSEKIFQIYQNDSLRKTMRVLHVNSIARSMYFLLFKPSDGKCSYTIDGITVQFCVSNDNEREYILSGASLEYDTLKRLLKHVKTGDVVYDIGAAIGFYSMFLAKKVGPSGRVISFEPDSLRYKTLCDNVKLNNMNNVTTFNLAISNSKTQGFLTRVTGSDLRVEMTANKELQNQAIDIIPGDFIMDEKKMPAPNVIKIDVEGYEYFVLEGLKKTLRQSLCRMVCCEVHFNQLPEGVKSQMIFDELKSAGFNNIEQLPQPHGSTLHLLCSKT